MILQYLGLYRLKETKCNCAGVYPKGSNRVEFVTAFDQIINNERIVVNIGQNVEVTDATGLELLKIKSSDGSKNVNAFRSVSGAKPNAPIVIPDAPKKKALTFYVDGVEKHSEADENSSKATELLNDYQGQVDAGTLILEHVEQTETAIKRYYFSVVYNLHVFFVNGVGVESLDFKKKADEQLTPEEQQKVTDKFNLYKNEYELRETTRDQYVTRYYFVTKPKLTKTFSFIVDGVIKETVVATEDETIEQMRMKTVFDEKYIYLNTQAMPNGEDYLYTELATTTFNVHTPEGGITPIVKKTVLGQENKLSSDELTKILGNSLYAIEADFTQRVLGDNAQELKFVADKDIHNKTIAVNLVPEDDLEDIEDLPLYPVEFKIGDLTVAFNEDDRNKDMVIQNYLDNWAIDSEEDVNGVTVVRLKPAQSREIRYYLNWYDKSLKINYGQFTYVKRMEINEVNTVDYTNKATQQDQLIPKLHELASSLSGDFVIYDIKEQSITPNALHASGINVYFGRP